MKKWLILLGMVGLLVGCATYRPGPPAGPYQKVIDVDGTKTELYVKAMDWMTKTFVSAKAVIQFQDKEAGIIVGKARVLVPYPKDTILSGTKWPLEFDLKIETKDKRARFTFENFMMITNGVAGVENRMPLEEQAGLATLFHEQLDPIIDSFKDFSGKTNSDF